MVHRCACNWCLFIVVILFIVLLFAAKPFYEFHTGGDVAVINLSYETPYANADASIQLHPILAHRYGNHSRDVCIHPFEFACEIDEPHYPRLFYEHNRKMLDHILRSSRLSKNTFLDSCLKFHMLSIEERHKRISNAPFFRTMLDRIQRVNESSALFALVSYLHRVGIREPFHVRILPSGEYQIAQPRPADSRDDLQMIEHFIPHILKMDPLSMTQNYLEVHRSIHWTNPSFEVVPWAELEGQLSWNISDWFVQVPNQIIVDVRTLRHFQEQVLKFPVAKWKDYLSFVTIRWVLHQNRLMMPTDHRICYQQFIEYYPLTVCRAIRAEVHHREDLEDLRNQFSAGFRKQMFEKNVFRFPDYILQYIQREYDALHIYINQCALQSHNATLSSLENYFLANHSGSYFDLTSQINAHAEFRERRHVDYDIYYRKLVDSFIQWNAWFDETIRGIVIPPGILMFPSHKMKHGSAQYYLSLKAPMYHELFHFVYYHLQKFPSHQWGATFRYFASQISLRYGSPSPDVHEENMADNAGLFFAWKTWYNERRRAEEAKTFILSYVRLFCRSEEDLVQTDHGNPRDRGTFPLWMISRDFNRLFNCTGSSALGKTYELL